MLYKCRVCNEEKAVDLFYKTNKYMRKICRKCENIKANKHRIARGRLLKLKAVEYLGGKCCICGYNKSIYALDFAHKQDKCHEPTRMFHRGMSWVRIKKEIDKCNLKCANCHREETHGDVDL